MPPTKPQGLLSRRLLLVSGKGGVGKTTVAVALARLAVRAGKRTLLCGVDTAGELGRLLGRPGLDAEPVDVAGGFRACDLDGHSAMREFLRMRLKIHAIADRVASNKAFAGFFTAAPGLREYVLLGKAWYEARERAGWLGDNSRNDLVILDAPATGHAAAFLRAAHQITDIMVGPLQASARQIRDFLVDPALTALVLVATPEELAVNEAVELSRHARRELSMHVGLVVLNSVFPVLFETETLRAVRGLAHDGREGRDRALIDAAHFRAQRESEQTRLLQRAKRALPKPQATVERVLDPDDEEEVLAAMTRALGEAAAP